MPENSVAAFFANPVRNRANDVDYIYHQDPDLYYLTGYKEPHAVLLIFKENQTDSQGKVYNEIFFVQTRNEQAEMWNGRRLGNAGVKEKLGILNAYNNTDFKDYNINFEKFDKILFYDFKNDVRDNARDESDLFSLIQQFKTKVGYGVESNSLGAEPKKNNLDLRGLNSLMADLRGIKTEEELDLLRKAVFISAVGQVEVMKAMHPGMTEAEVQGIHEFVFKKYGSEYEGYPSIVGAGNNGCILHYIENTEIDIKSDEMILMERRCRIPRLHRRRYAYHPYRWSILEGRARHIRFSLQSTRRGNSNGEARRYHGTNGSPCLKNHQPRSGRIRNY